MQELNRGAFGEGFQFGVATSAYQIEGAVTEDGRLPSIWDVFSHTPDKTKDGANADVACDHYHRLEQDLELLDWLGVDCYRFSIAWPRVVPHGCGAPNPSGLDFYERLVDGLLSRGITPCATLYHWDLPQALQRERGWLNRDTTKAFADYAAVVAKRLGDRVGLWLTHNEPWCQAFLGYETGLFAPGHRDLSEALLCAHHLLLSHGLATASLSAFTTSPIGIALNLMPVHPVTAQTQDLAAARRQDGYVNRWFVDPVAGRGYPNDMLALYGSSMPKFPDSDLDLIAAPLDALGVNYYERAVVASNPGAGVLELKRIKTTECPRTADREIYPEGLGEVLRRLHNDYEFPRLVVTENGAAFDDRVESDGSIKDAAREAFLRAHLLEVRKARDEGVPVDTYCAWSLMDNFEWSEGYSLRYGIVHIDFETLQRTPKQSAHFLRALCRSKL